MIKFDLTIKVFDTLFIIFMIVLAYIAVNYDIAKANECIEKMNNCTKLIVNLVNNSTENMTDFNITKWLNDNKS